MRDYPQLSVRVPPETKLRLGALGVMQSKPQWRIVLESIECLIGSLSESDQRMLKELIKRPR
jgi:predicted DNA-binding protein